MRIVLSVVIAALAAGCGDDASPTYQLRGDDRPGDPVASLTAAQEERFDRGDTVFERVFRDAEGLGPVYIRASCASCHAGDSKGPGVVRRMAIVGADGFTPAVDQGALSWGGVVREFFVSPATRPVLPPDARMDLRVSERVGPAVFARGWMDAIDASEISRVAAEQRASGGPVHGRVPMLPDGRLGRFGLKATVPTLEDFAANAFLGDMGLTSPTRTEEVPNPDGLHDDARPGLDLTADQVNDAAFYVRALAMPSRTDLTARGRELFASAGCASCHTPSLATRADFEVSAMANGRAEVFTDMLLHDMGVGLADGVAEGAAGPRDWRTAPLIGMRFIRSFLHDGRARTVESAIGMHRSEGSESNASVDAFDALSVADRNTLIEYVRAL